MPQAVKARSQNQHICTHINNVYMRQMSNLEHMYVIIIYMFILRFKN